MRKTMQKEVTKTKVKIARMEMKDGHPVAIPLEDEILLGNVNLERAQKEINRKYRQGVTVFTVEPETVVYEMDVLEFIKHAKIKEEN